MRSECGRTARPVSDRAELTSSGKSTMVPSFSEIPSVTMNRLVRGPRRLRHSFSTHKRTSSRVKTFEVIMIEPADGETGYLKALLDSKIDTPVGNNEVATLSKGKDYARYRRESLGVQNRGLCSEEVCYCMSRTRSIMMCTTTKRICSSGLNHIDSMVMHQWCRRIQEVHSYRDHISEGSQ